LTDDDDRVLVSEFAESLGQPIRDGGKN